MIKPAPLIKSLAVREREMEGGGEPAHANPALTHTHSASQDLPKLLFTCTEGARSLTSQRLAELREAAKLNCERKEIASRERSVEFCLS